MRSSLIRELLSIASPDNTISFAGGLPARSALPELTALPVVRDDFQYGSSEGKPALRQRIADDLESRGLRVDPAHVIVLSGSLQGIDVAAKLAIDPGT